jgi:toxin ParE1/3/4
MIIEELSPNPFRFPLKSHVIDYLKKDEMIIFIRIISSEMSPEKHLFRK